MPQDFAQRKGQASGRGQGARRNASAPDSGGNALPFTAGLATGLLLALLIWLAGFLPDAPPSRVVTAPSPSTASESTPAPGIRFEFPDMLRDAEVLVPYVEEYLQEPAVEEQVEYMLQAGAFRNPDDADRRRAAILLLDMQARTVRITRQGESWHRVLVGPFGDRDAVRQAQVLLLGEDIDSIVLRASAGNTTG